MNNLWEEKKKEYIHKITIGLSEIKAIKFGDFTLTSGKWSPFYLDLRIAPSFPSFFDLVTDCYVDIIKNEIDENIDRIAGVLTAGVPIATLVSHKMVKPMIYVRSKAKEHGRKKLIEGVLEPNDNVIVIDDLVTSGGSVVETIKIIREEKAIANHAVVLVDRQQGALENLNKLGVKLHVLVKVTELIELLYKHEKITEEQFKIVMDYLRKE